MKGLLLEVFKRYSFKQKQVILLALTALAIFFVGIQALVSPDLKAIQSHKKLLADTITRKSALLQAQPLESQIRGYREFLPVSKAPEWMMRAANAAASGSGLSVTSVSPQSSEKDENFERQSVLLEAEGGYHQVGKFLEAIENSKPSILLGQLRLEKPKMEEGPIDNNKKLKIYVLLYAYRELSGSVR